MTDINLESVNVEDRGYSPYVSDGTDGFTHGNWITWDGMKWVDTANASDRLVTYATDPANIADGTYYLKSYQEKQYGDSQKTIKRKGEWWV